MQEDIQILQNSDLFNGIGADEIKAMLHCLMATSKTFEKDQFIIHAGDKVNNVGMVISGSAIIIKEDFWGNRNLMSVIEPGDMFGEVYACLPNTEVTVAVVAKEPTKVMFFNMKRILTTCSNSCEFHASLINNMITALATYSVRMNNKLDHMSKRTTREKLLSYLSSEAMRAGSATFTIPLNRQQLADYLSVDRSAMSSELSKMQKEGLIEYNRNDFTLYEID